VAATAGSAGEVTGTHGTSRFARICAHLVRLQ
jgi:hypothetical protein